MNTLADSIHWLDLDGYLFAIFQWHTFLPRTELYIIDKFKRLTYAARVDGEAA